MPTLTDQLRDSAPDKVTPLDHHAVADRAISLRRRRRLGQAGMASFAVVALVLSVVWATDDGGTRTTVANPPVAPDGTVLTDGFGTWTEGTESPLGARSNLLHGLLSDGRVLVWGGNGAPHPVGPPEQTGAIYDPDTDEWTPIPAAPLPLKYSRLHLADDQMLITGVTPDGAFAANVYDVRTDTWTELPAQSEISILADAIAWDGTTAVLIRLEEGGVGIAEGTGIDPDVDWTVDEPVTLRWSRGDDEWSRGAAPPVSLRSGAGTLHHDGSVYLVGGAAANYSADYYDDDRVADSQLHADGVVYDIADDEWSTLPDLPEPGERLNVGALADGRILAGGALSHSAPDDSYSHSWTFDGDAWIPFASHPEPQAAAVVRNDVVQTMELEGHSGPQPEWIFTDGSWERAPFADLHRWGDLILATSSTGSNPHADSFAVKLRGGPNSWVTSADAPFPNRRNAAIHVSGDRLVVIGGSDHLLDSTASVWILNLTD